MKFSLICNDAVDVSSPGLSHELRRGILRVVNVRWREEGIEGGGYMGCLFYKLTIIKAAKHEQYLVHQLRPQQLSSCLHLRLN